MSPDKTFDWVSARASCTSKMLFSALKQVVEADVRSAKARVCDGFSVQHGPHDDAFSVRLDMEHGMMVRARTFELVGQEIRAYQSSSESDVILTGRASLVADGECLIDTDEQKPPLRLWEFSRLALEDFFFAGR